MDCRLDRRSFLAVGGVGMLGGRLSGAGSYAGASFPRGPADDPTAAFPRQVPGLVQELVGASHGNFDRVRELVDAYPELAKSSVDWGFGDWESALGAAAHTGRVQIAEYLLAHGARPNLFSAAMLGQLDVVRAMVEASPGVQSTPGPHGITLLAHARAGGDRARAVHDYLLEVGGADPRPVSEPMDDAVRTGLLGAYRYGPGDDELIEVTDRSGTVFLGRTGQTARGLTHHGGLVFHPAGAPSVRIAFRGGNPPATVHITMGVIEAVGRRGD